MTKTVVITGGTGLLGSELVSQLLRDGFDVITTSTRDCKTGNFQRFGQNLTVQRVDFMEQGSLEDFEKFLISQPRIDYLVNNARSLKYLGTNTEGFCSIDDLVSEFTINVATSMRLSVLLAGQSIGLQGVINISSQYGSVVPNPLIYEKIQDMSPIQYNVSKAALDKLTRELAVRFGEKGIRVNGIGYGGIKGRAPARFVSEYEKIAPHSHMLDVSECYAPLRLLVSDDSTAMNGQIIEANAGWTLC